MRPCSVAMSGIGVRGQSSRSLINDFQLQSYGGEALALSSHVDSYALEVEFSDIDLNADPSPAQQTKVLMSAVSEETCLLAFACLEQLQSRSRNGPAVESRVFV